MRYKPFQEGDVVWGPDAYHDDDPTLEEGGIRPWVVLSTGAYPRQGEEYLCCALTSNVRPDETLIPLAQSDWEKPGALKPGQLDPATVVCMKHDWICRYTGRLAHRPLARARKLLVSFLTPPKG